MGDAEDLLRFAEDFQQEVVSAADLEGEEKAHADAFTERMISILTDNGDITGGEVCYHYARGTEVSGYSVSDDELSLTVFLSIFTRSFPPSTVGKSDIEGGLKRLATYVDKALSGYHVHLEEASPQFDMSLRISELIRRLVSVNLYILTDGIVNYLPLESTDVHGLPAQVHIWDIRRTFRCATSGQHRESIRIDFQRDFGGGLPCLAAEAGEKDYAAYLAIVPGTVLADVYGRYGSRLLELNVRSFLQVRGKVNQGIRRTILEQPQRFLAYNNGLAATASRVVVETGRGAPLIVLAEDLQIVNGGQTTASLFQAARRDKADLANVYVQLKITVVPPDRLADVVPQISRYANSQNKVNDADFRANDTYHVALEKWSRTVWAPSSAGTQHQTRWFYERARGQYLDALHREGTPARQRQWKSLHPLHQKFTKTDLAKFENTWAMLPHVVSTGSEKNFNAFTIDLKERGVVTVSERQFKDITARALLFRRAEQIVTHLSLGGYRANIVTYSLAYLFYRAARRIDLERVWREQSISPALTNAIEHIAQAVHPVLTQPPNGANITEWCKRPECWRLVKDIQLHLPAGLSEDLISVLASAPDARAIDGLSDSERESVARVVGVPADMWLRLSRWGAQTGSLGGWQRQIAYSLGRQAKQGRSPSVKQARQGMVILEEAGRLGFSSEAGGDATAS
jgi:hypothetical protein